jgi:hypothetical protein
MLKTMKRARICRHRSVRSPEKIGSRLSRHFTPQSPEMRAAFAFTVLALLAVSALAFTDFQYETLFRKWKAAHGKVYHKDEFSMRFSTFKVL